MSRKVTRIGEPCYVLYFTAHFSPDIIPMLILAELNCFLTVADHDNRGGADPYVHLHKEQLARSAVLFGVGVLKGAVVTTLLNSYKNDGGITIGKK